jgi:hypothetical protein
MLLLQVPGTASVACKKVGLGDQPVLACFCCCAGTCDTNDDCTLVDPETMCVKTQQTPLCTCSDGLESCRIIGRWVL